MITFGTYVAMLISFWNKSAYFSSNGRRNGRKDKKQKQYAKIPLALEKLVYAKKECFSTKRHKKQEVKKLAQS